MTARAPATGGVRNEGWFQPNGEGCASRACPGDAGGSGAAGWCLPSRKASKWRIGWSVGSGTIGTRTPCTTWYERPADHPRAENEAVPVRRHPPVSRSHLVTNVIEVEVNPPRRRRQVSRRRSSRCNCACNSGGEPDGPVHAFSGLRGTMAPREAGPVGCSGRRKSLKFRLFPSARAVSWHRDTRLRPQATPK